MIRVGFLQLSHKPQRGNGSLSCGITGSFLPLAVINTDNRVFILNPNTAGETLIQQIYFPVFYNVRHVCRGSEVVCLLCSRYVPTMDDVEMYKSHKGPVAELHIVDQYMLEVQFSSPCIN